MSSVNNQNMLSQVQANRAELSIDPVDRSTLYASANAFNYDWFELSVSNSAADPIAQSPISVINTIYPVDVELASARSIESRVERIIQYFIDEQPDWIAASHELANQLQQLNDLDSRVDLLDSLCNRLGPDMYPAFLQLLFFLEHHTDAKSKKQLTDTLVYAMGTGRLPSGTLQAWGSTSSTSSNPYRTARTLGPIEFLCAWYAQPTNLPQIQDAKFDDALSTLLRLIDSNKAARKMYCYNLNMDAINDSVGMFSQATRTAMTRLAKAWNANGCADKLAAQFIIDVKASHSIIRF